MQPDSPPILNEAYYRQNFLLSAIYNKGIKIFKLSMSNYQNLNVTRDRMRPFPIIQMRPTIALPSLTKIYSLRLIVGVRARIYLVVAIIPNIAVEISSA